MPIHPNPLPRWRGFNLLEKFTANNASQSVTFAERTPRYRESDFQAIADWGFDFVRFPTSYHCWSSPDAWLEMDEAVLAHIDEGITLGQRYGIHVSLNLHRAPGYCINPPREPRNLWRDADALEACCHHWRTFARRYQGIPSTQLSFDLINEPLSPSEDYMTRADHERVIRALVAAIREVDPDRLIIADGLGGGNDPIPELADLGIAQSCRAYLPMGISHYQARWARGETFPEPVWPGGYHYGATWTRADLEAHYGKWAEWMAHGVGIHCGEGGCFNRTPHGVFLAWFRDVLEILTGLGIGYALWNFRGAFGILDSGRSDVAYEDWHGHQLDRELLKLLQEF